MRASSGRPVGSSAFGSWAGVSVWKYLRAMSSATRSSSAPLTRAFLRTSSPSESSTRCRICVTAAAISSGSFDTSAGSSSAIAVSRSISRSSDTSGSQACSSIARRRACSCSLAASESNRSCMPLRLRRRPAPAVAPVPSPLGSLHDAGLSVSECTPANTSGIGSTRWLVAGQWLANVEPVRARLRLSAPANRSTSSCVQSGANVTPRRPASRKRSGSRQASSAVSPLTSTCSPLACTTIRSALRQRSCRIAANASAAVATRGCAGG